MANELKTTKLVLIGGEPIRLPIRAADPVSGMVEGDLYYNSTSKTARIYDGTVWAAVAGVSEAVDVSFDNAVSGLAANDVQAAIDETVGLANSAQADATQALSDALLAQQDADQAQITADDALADAQEALSKANDLVTLSGVIANSTDLGTFTGTIIPDASDVKVALQSLETATEASQVDATQALADAATAQSDATQALADAATAQASADAALADAADLVTLSGVGANNTDLGTFTGTTIPDASTIKGALQSLETAVEAVPSSSTVDDIVTLTGVAANSVDLGTFTGTLIPDASTIKGALQAVETGAEAAQVDATQALSDAADAQTDVNDLVTLSGVPVNSADLGSFTGNVIPATSTIKQALQYLGDGLENLPDPIVYLGTWSAATNTPTLADGGGVSGSLYQVSAAGSVDFGSGAISFEIGDKVVYNGTIWEKWDMTDAVTSVNGQAGVVVLDSDDISEGASNLYFTDTRAKTAAVADAIVDGVTDVAPSQNAVFDALALKADSSALADVVEGPASATDNAVVRFDATTGKLVQDSVVTIDDTGAVAGVDTLDVVTSAVIGDISVGVASSTSITATSLTLESDTGSVQIISETDVILDSSVSGSVVVAADVPFKRGGVTDAVEERYYHALSLAANVATFTTISGLSFANATYDGMLLEFKIKEATTGLVRIGKMYIAADGTDVSFSPQYAETGIVGAVADGEGLKLQATLSGGDILIQFKDTKAANACTMNLDVKLFKA